MNIGFLIFPCLERFLTPRVSGFPLVFYSIT